uniref:NADH-ubiquinone oxidoreductase chain 5 n=1 Tax=Trigonopterus sp. 2 AH-2016 TaxID=1903836 RepID=A0A343C3Z2_9CUCU|nr:NADH dehydrogenase subunit 5 [Trigonopterus sp. 2 AH-2016]
MVLCWLVSSLFMVFSVTLYILGMWFMYWNFEVFVEFDILTFNSLSVELAVMLDWISLMFTSFVFLISSLIVMYSMEYMEGNKTFSRFIWTMILFVLSMVVVIMSSNLVFILLGWDGLGLVSYVLVIYFQNVKSYNAGMLTALSNRIGDAAILLGLVLMMDLGSWSYGSFLFMEVPFFKGCFFLSLMIILAAMTKSAQIPFSSWLPAAMAAPTPVSSLVHSSTLVTAGVYLLFRFSDLLSMEVKSVFLVLSLLTMFMAGLGANFEFDLKKIIALSTLSQLGMMMTIFYLGDKDLAFFHLLMHALFKALLFMCAGVIIHSIGDYQDIRYMGGLMQFFPLSCACMGVSSFALCGLPFLSGFYSKDLILEVVSMGQIGWFVYWLFYISIGLTVSYSMRLFMYVSMGRFNVLSVNSLVESTSGLMLKSMVPLSILVIFKGSWLLWLGFSTPYFIVLPMFMKFMVLVSILFGCVLGWEISCFKVTWNSSALKFYYTAMFSSGMWNLPVLSTSSLNSFFLGAGKLYMKSLDYGWTEYYGSKGLFSVIKDFIYIFQLISRNHLKLSLLLVWGIFLILILFSIY